MESKNMRLLIVESPGKIKKIKSFLGAGWQVKASVGHVRDLPQKQLGIQVNAGRVALDYEVSKDKSRVVKDLRKAAGEAQEIYLAMDMDREGEAIAWHVGMLLGKKNWPKIKRVTFTEITKPALEAALRQPRSLCAPLVHAQQARRAVDRLVGFRVSPYLWKCPGVGKSAGRVQSLAVRLVVEKERAIRSFKPQEYWKIKAHLSKAGAEESFWAELFQWKGKQLVGKFEEGKEKGQCILASRAQAEELIQALESDAWRVKDQKSREQKQRPYPPFITSTLQQAASGRLKWSSKQAMQVAQLLYEKGLITYMRTDSTQISEEALTQARDFIGQHFAKDYLPKQPVLYQKKVRNAQEAHECIRPTNIALVPSQADLAPNERALYDLIWRRFVACQMAPANYHVVTLDVNCGEAIFRARGRRCLFDGYQRVAGKQSDQKKDEVEVEELPQLEVGQKLDCGELQPSQHFTQAPPRYTEASLIKALEKMGIGRPSTYASIMETIKKRGYVTEEKRAFKAEGLGEAQVDYLMARFAGSFMDYSFTAAMEDLLDSVAEGKQSWHEVVIRFDAQLGQLLAQHQARLPR